MALGRLTADLAERGFVATHDDLRRKELRQYLEQKQAALFAYFVSESRVKAPVEYAMIEDEDYDCVLRFKLENQRGYARVH